MGDDVDARAEHVLDPLDAHGVFDRRQALETVPRLEGQVHVDQLLAGRRPAGVAVQRQPVLADKPPRGRQRSERSEGGKSIGERSRERGSRANGMPPLSPSPNGAAQLDSGGPIRLATSVTLKENAAATFAGKAILPTRGASNEDRVAIIPPWWKQWKYSTTQNDLGLYCWD